MLVVQGKDFILSFVFVLVCFLHCLVCDSVVVCVLFFCFLVVCVHPIFSHLIVRTLSLIKFGVGAVVFVVSVVMFVLCCYFCVFC